MTSAEETTSPKRPACAKIIWAALLGFLIPGLGQIYAKSWQRGITLLILYFIYSTILFILQRFLNPTATTLAILSILGIAMLALLIWSGADAAKQSRLDRRHVKKLWYKSAWFTFIVYFLAAGCSNAILPQAWHSYAIPSESGLPTLLVGDHFMTKTIHSTADLQRGDIIVFHPPGEPKDVFVKRLVGLPGDQVQITAGILYLNQKPVARTALGVYDYRDNGQNISAQEYKETLFPDKSYSILKMTDTGFVNNTPLYTVPPGDVFVLGDNRDDSLDSRFMDGPVGYVPEANIIGKVELIYWPLSRFQQIK